MKFPDYSIIEKSKSDDVKGIKLSLSLNPDLDFFDGHFDQKAILPAVAQLHLVNQFAIKYFDRNLEFNGLRQLKFMSPIQPMEPVILTIQYDPLNARVVFTFEVHDKVKSKGALLIHQGDVK